MVIYALMVSDAKMAVLQKLACILQSRISVECASIHCGHQLHHMLVFHHVSI